MTIAGHLESVNGGVIVMSSHGRGRSAGLLGSVATGVLNETFGPVIVVGPDAQIDRPNFRGEIVVTVDGSPHSETALGLAGAWGIGLGARPWVATVIETAAPPPVGVDTFESAYPAQLAHYLESMSKHPVEFEVLHGGDPAMAVADFAASIDAGLLVATTHGRTGLARLTLGSVAARLVRLAPCPVVLLRPPTLPRPTQSTASALAAVIDPTTTSSTKPINEGDADESRRVPRTWTQGMGGGTRSHDRR